MTKHRALEVLEKYKKHNPFIRLTDDQQKEFNQAYEMSTDHHAECSTIQAQQVTSAFSEALF